MKMIGGQVFCFRMYNLLKNIITGLLNTFEAIPKQNELMLRTIMVPPP